MSTLTRRFEQNPIIRKEDIRPSQSGLIIECVLNPGVFTFKDKLWLILRVAERPRQDGEMITFPVMTVSGELEILKFNKKDPQLDLSDTRYVKVNGSTFLSTISHLRLWCSEDGIHFYEPTDLNPVIYGAGPLETFGIEDCRVCQIGDTYYLTFTQVSEHGVGVGLMSTKDWKTFDKKGMILPPHNKDCALFDEKIDGSYFCLHRPSGIDLGGNFIWLSSSPDLVHWGKHQCIAHTRKGMWDSARIGAGASPIKTEEGWLAIYHGADSQHRYSLGAILMDLHDPSKILARSSRPLLEPETEYEKNGFFGNVVFTNGHAVEGDVITMYYGASDEVICGATLHISEILADLKTFA
jgi:predicted GH43/DUF377 family glycosyl hydrolase